LNSFIDLSELAHQKTSHRAGVRSPRRIPCNGKSSFDPATKPNNRDPTIPSRESVTSRVIADADSKGKNAKGVPTNKVLLNTPV
jgi:hypothetical protein